MVAWRGTAFISANPWGLPKVHYTEPNVYQWVSKVSKDFNNFLQETLPMLFFYNSSLEMALFTPCFMLFLTKSFIHPHFNVVMLLYLCSSLKNPLIQWHVHKIWSYIFHSNKLHVAKNCVFIKCARFLILFIKLWRLRTCWKCKLGCFGRI